VTAILVCAGMLGAIVGSFLNVVIHRLPQDEPLGLFRRTRSACPACGAGIAWYDNLPLLSFFVLRGRCRACRGRISLRYPLVEAVTAALFVLCAERTFALPWSPRVLGFLVAAAFTAVLVAASAIDFQLKILPDKLTLRAGPLICLVGALGVPGFHGTDFFGVPLAESVKPSLASLVVGVAGAIVAGGIIAAIRSLGTLIVRREAMGLGDVKFMAMCGLLLGPWPAVLAIMVAVVGGAVLGGAIWAVTRNREIPFGPFLAMGALAVLFYGDAIHHLIFVTYPAWVGGR